MPDCIYSSGQKSKLRTTGAVMSGTQLSFVRSEATFIARSLSLIFQKTACFWPRGRLEAAGMSL